MRTALRYVLPLLLIAVVWLLHMPARSADITWRGPEGGLFIDKENWNLPPGAMEESERRVPGGNDVAIIGNGTSPLLGGSVSVGAILMTSGELRMVLGSTLVVGESLPELTSIQRLRGDPGSRVTFHADTFLGSGLALGADWTFMANTEIGTLDAHSGAAIRFHAGTVVTHGSFGESLIEAPNRPGSAAEVLFQGMTLNRPADSLIAEGDFLEVVDLEGRMDVLGTVEWGNVNVNQMGRFDLTAESVANASVLMVKSAPANGLVPQWIGEDLRMQGNTRIVGADNAPVVFDTPVVMDTACRILPFGKFEFRRTMELGSQCTIAGPIDFTGLATVSVPTASTACEWTASERGSIRFLNSSSAAISADLVVAGVSLHDNASWFTTAAGSAERIRLRLIPTSLNGAPFLEFSGGSIQPATGRVLIDIPASETSVPASMRILGTCFVRADISNEGLILASNQPENATPQIQGHVTNFEDGNILMLSGSHLATGTDSVVINHGTIRATHPGAGGSTTPALPSRLCEALINDGGTVAVETGAEMQVGSGENTGSLILENEATFTVDTGARTDITYLQLDGTERTFSPNGLFHLRQSGMFASGLNSRIRLIGAGSFGFPEIVSGMLLETPIAIDLVEIGGPANAAPGFTFPATLMGTALTINKGFNWAGGGFRGASGATQRVAIAQGCAAALQSPGENGGSSLVARNCTIQNAGFAFVSTRNGIFATFENQESASLILARCDGNFAGFLTNNGTIIKRTDSRIALTASGVSSSPIIVEAGKLVVTGLTIEDEIQVQDQSASLDLFGARLRNLAITGPGGVALEQAFLEGDVSVRNVVIGNNTGPNAVTDAVTSVANTTFRITGSALWKTGHARLGNNNKIVVEAGAFFTIALENPSGFFTFLDRGVIENFGIVQFIAGTTSPLVPDSDVTFRNMPGASFEILTSPDSTAPSVDIFRSRAINSTLVSPMTFINEGFWRIRGSNLVRTYNFHPITENRAGTFDFIPAAPQAPVGALRVPRGGIGAGQNVFQFLEPLNITGGRFTVADLLLIAKKAAIASGGQWIFGEGGNGELQSTASVRNNGTVIALAPESTLTIPMGLDLVDQGTLTGNGFLVGNLRNQSGVISPGEDLLDPFGNLAVQGDVVFGMNAVFDVDIPVDGELFGDRIDIIGNGTFAGAIMAEAMGTNVTIADGTFIPLITYTTRTGEFSSLSPAQFGAGFAFQRAFQGTPEAFGVRFVGSGGPQADLALSASQPLPIAGRNFRQTFTVKNLGGDSANGVGLTITLPSNVTFVASNIAPASVAGQTLSFNLATLNRNKSQTITLTLGASSAEGALVQITATVMSNTPDPVPANNTLVNVSTVLPAAAATYRGFLLTDGTQSVGGSAVISLTPTGNLTARIHLDGVDLVFRGKLSGAGVFEKTIKHKTLGDVKLELSELDAVGLAGSLMIGDTMFSVDGRRNARFDSKEDPAPQTGRYTVLFNPGEEQESPEGAGFAIMTVSASGGLKLSGTMADNAKFMFAGALATDGSAQCFVPLYRKKGFVAGRILFRDRPNISDADAALLWVRPAALPDGLFPAGFTAGIDLEAARFNPPAAGSAPVPILPALDPLGDQGTLEFSGSALAQSITIPLAIMPPAKAIGTIPAGARFRITINSRTGIFNGDFRPQGGTNIRFAGAFLQKQNRAGGFFLQGPTTGLVSFLPAE